MASASNSWESLLNLTENGALEPKIIKLMTFCVFHLYFSKLTADCSRSVRVTKSASAKSFAQDRCVGGLLFFGVRYGGAIVTFFSIIAISAAKTSLQRRVKELK